MTDITHRERLEITLSGQTPDRVPVALWRHFPVDDQQPHALAEAVLAFQRLYNYDLVKVTPESTYFAKEWGVEDVWEGALEGTRAYTRRPIHDPEDWTRLKQLDPRAGRLGDQLVCLRAISAGLGPKVPFIETIFSPLTQARKMAGEARLLAHMRHSPEAVKTGLKTIAESTLDFISEAKKTGIAGIFYALQFAQFGLISESEFEDFEAQYHQEILAAAGDLWLNVLHLHGTEIMFERAAQLPVQVINWHDQETYPNLSGGKDLFGGVVCGGIRQWDTMAYGDPEMVTAESHAAIEATNGTRFILGTGCVTPIIASHGNLMAARRSVEAV